MSMQAQVVYPKEGTLMKSFILMLSLAGFLASSKAHAQTSSTPFVLDLDIPAYQVIRLSEGRDESWELEYIPNPFNDGQDLLAHHTVHVEYATNYTTASPRQIRVSVAGSGRTWEDVTMKVTPQTQDNVDKGTNTNPTRGYLKSALGHYGSKGATVSGKEENFEHVVRTNIAQVFARIRVVFQVGILSVTQTTTEVDRSFDLTFTIEEQ